MDPHTLFSRVIGDTGARRACEAQRQTLHARKTLHAARERAKNIRYHPLAIARESYIYIYGNPKQIVSEKSSHLGTSASGPATGFSVDAT